MLPGSEPRRILHGRRENQTIHDENGMRHYYSEWGKWMNRLPGNPASAVRWPPPLPTLRSDAGHRADEARGRMS